MEVSLPVAAGLFLLSALMVVSAAFFLASSADVIASRMGLGRLWVGSLLLAGATSLPEIVTAAAAARAGNASLAAGNIFGANMLNMSNLAVLFVLFGGYQVFQRLAPTQVLVAFSAIVLTGVATLFAVASFELSWLQVSLPALIIFAVYVVFSRILRKASANASEPDEMESSHSLRWGWMVFGAAAAVIFLSGPLLASSAERIADLTGVASSFMGVLALAFVTTLPELSATLAAFRMGAFDLGVANMYGTNSFNIVALGVADLFYPGGTLFRELDVSHVAAGLFALLLMGIGTLQLAKRRPLKRFSLTEPSPPLFVGLYILGLFVVFYLG